MATAVDDDEAPSLPVAEIENRRLDKDIWAIAWPAMLSYFVVNVVDVVDVALVGRLGRRTVAAWGYSAQCVHLVETLIQSVGVGCVALVARAVGARDSERARRILAGSVVLSVSLSALTLLLVLAVPRFLLGLLDADPAVVRIAVPFFRLFAGAMLLYGAAFMFESSLRAHRNTRGPMVIAFLVMSVKTAVSLLLVFGLFGFPRLELVGAGIATLTAHAVGLLLYVLLCRRAAREGLAVSFGLRELRGLFDIGREVLAVSLPSMGERLIMSLALLTYFKILSVYGTAAIAAYAIGVRLLSFSWVPGLGFAASASTIVGQALGAGNSQEARRAGRRAVGQAVGVMCVLGSAFLFLRTPLARAFTTDAQVADNLVSFMMMLAVAQPFMAAHFTLGGVLRGAGDTMTPLVGAALGNWGLRVPLAWVFARVFGTSLTWVWAVLIADHFTRMLVNGAAFARGVWAKRTGALLAPGPEAS